MKHRCTMQVRIQSYENVVELTEVYNMERIKVLSDVNSLNQILFDGSRVDQQGRVRTI